MQRSLAGLPKATAFHPGGDPVLSTDPASDLVSPCRGHDPGRETMRWGGLLCLSRCPSPGSRLQWQPWHGHCQPFPCAALLFLGAVPGVGQDGSLNGVYPCSEEGSRFHRGQTKNSTSGELVRNEAVSRPALICFRCLLFHYLCVGGQTGMPFIGCHILSISKHQRTQVCHGSRLSTCTSECRA